MLTKDWLNFLPKSNFFENVVQHQDFQTFWAKSRFLKIVTRIDIFRKFWPKSTFSKIWRKIKMFENENVFPKARLFENLTIIDILQNFCPIQMLSTISTKIEIIENFDQNRDFQILCPKREIIANNADENKIFKKKMAKSRSFRERRPISRFPKTFWPKSKFSIISTRSEIFRFFFFF